MPHEVSGSWADDARALDEQRHDEYEATAEPDFIVVNYDDDDEEEDEELCLAQAPQNPLFSDESCNQSSLEYPMDEQSRLAAPPDCLDEVAVPWPSESDEPSRCIPRTQRKSYRHQYDYTHNDSLANIQPLRRSQTYDEQKPSNHNGRSPGRRRQQPSNPLKSATREKGSSTRQPQKPQMDVRVILSSSATKTGLEEFFHSSVVLQYAAPVLSQYMVAVPTRRSNRAREDHEKEQRDNRNSTGSTSSDRSHSPQQIRYELDLSHRPAYEWKCLAPFLQPHTRQAAIVTPHHLVTLLKWLDELDLRVQLAECDEILSSLEWPWNRQAATMSASTENPTVSSLAQRDTEITAWKDHVHDLLVVSQIAGRCNNHLPKSHSMAWKNWNQLFWHSPHALCHDLDLLHGLADLLANSAIARQTFWLTLIRYLPPDLEVYSTPQLDLVTNPLFPYLLREGLQKHVREQELETMKNAPLVEKCLPQTTSEDSSDTGTPIEITTENGTATVVVTPDKSPQDGDDTIPQGVSQQLMLLENGVEDWQESFQEWWNMWSGNTSNNEINYEGAVPSLNHQQSSEDGASIQSCPPQVSSMICPVKNNRTLERNDEQQVFPVQGAQRRLKPRNQSSSIPVNRSQWLDQIWQRLQGGYVLPDLPASPTPDRIDENYQLPTSAKDGTTDREGINRTTRRKSKAGRSSGQEGKEWRQHSQQKRHPGTPKSKRTGLRSSRNSLDGRSFPWATSSSTSYSGSTLSSTDSPQETDATMSSATYTQVTEWTNGAPRKFLC